MSHELRTPMNAILGMIDLALPKAVDPTVQDYLKTAKESADLLLALLNDLLDSARIESGKLELEVGALQPRDSMLEQIARDPGRCGPAKRGCGSRCRIARRAPDVFVGDRTATAAGAVEPGRQRDQVHRSAARWRSASSARAAERSRAACEFAVRDTGIGIPPEDRAAIFQPLHAGRRLDHAALRRHRPGPVDLAAAWSSA